MTGTDISDLKALCAGAGVAAALGLLLGAASKPDLGDDNRPAGPQILAQAPGAGPSGPFDDGATFAAYKGRIPDYVLGTDFKRALTPPPETAYAEKPVRLARQDREMLAAQDADTSDLPPVDLPDHEAAPERVSYPSIDGGRDPAPDEPGGG